MAVNIRIKTPENRPNPAYSLEGGTFLQFNSGRYCPATSDVQRSAQINNNLRYYIWELGQKILLETIQRVTGLARSLRTRD
jgi:hypothetical protein